MSFKPALVVLLPFGMILLSLVFFSRGILIFLTAFCLMVTQSHIVEVRSITLYLRWVFFFLFAFHVFGDIFLGRTVRNIKSFDVVAIFFIVYAFMSTSYSPYPSLTLERSTTILLLYISVFWIIWKYAFEQGPEKIIHIVLQVTTIIFIASFLMLFIGPYRPFLVGRFTGIFNNPNSLGIICAMLMPLALWEYLTTQNKTYLILFFIMLVSLFLSVSRGSINAAILGLIYFIYARSKKYRPAVFFFSVAVILTLLWLIQTVARHFFLVYFRVESIPTGAGRFEVWPVALRLILESPIFGYGFGVEETLLKLKHIVPRIHPGGYFHNSYLGITLQLGLLGAVILLFPLFTLLFKELFSKQDDNAPLLRYALRASLIAGLASGLFESWFYSVGNSQSFPFWIIVMLLTFYRYQYKEKDSVEGT
ncbi:MAG: hypothetical protein A3K83_01100 [Omnitrophica WOR_2 bacterium RBG_13_44_8b]|nr:MAG: hypothetical protein A3K83_01100 [Omnitrophica WOR_2 bacterium RBG_13_44_8b]